MHSLRKAICTKPMWTSYVSCLKAISDYLELGHSTAWVCGASGHAFIMNISADLCPSGPTAFSDKPMAALCINLGIILNGTVFDKNVPDFDRKQNEAWEMTCKAIDNDMPTFGWEMGNPEYHIVYGYDNENYLYYDCRGNPNIRKWNTLGKTDIGVVSLFSANKEDALADVNKTLRDAFTFALDFSKHKKEWTYPLYYNGIKAYDVWINALQSENVNPFGLAYNAAVWSECRTMAHEFLLEAAKKLETNLLDNLIEHYDVINWSMQKIAKLFPMPPSQKELDAETIESAIDNLFLAKEAEKAAFVEMKQLITQL